MSNDVAETCIVLGIIAVSCFFLSWTIGWFSEMAEYEKRVNENLKELRKDDKDATRS